MRFSRSIAVALASALAVGPVAASAEEQKITLEQGTAVELVLSETVSSADERVGNTVAFEVVEDVKIGDLVVIPRGAPAWATVTVAEPKKRMGRGGKLDMNIDKVRLADGEKVLLSAVKGGKGGGHTGAMVGAMVATSLIVWPAAPFFLLMHGKDITIPKGTKLTAYVMGDATLDSAKFTAAALAAKVPQSAAVASPAPAVPAAPGTVPASGPQPEMLSADPAQTSLGEVARQYRDKKAQPTPQTSNPNQTGPPQP